MIFKFFLDKKIIINRLSNVFYIFLAAVSLIVFDLNAFAMINNNEGDLEVVTSIHSTKGIRYNQAEDEKPLGPPNIAFSTMDLLNDPSILSQDIYTPYIERAIKILETTSGKIKLSLIPTEKGATNININIVRDKEELGKIKFSVKNKQARLMDIRIKNAFQGQGIGKDALLSFYKLMDCLGIWKTTCALQSENPYTAKLYLTVGMRFEIDALKTLASIYGNFDCGFEIFLKHSGISNTTPLEMFRVGNTPFEDSTPDQKNAFLTLK